MTVEDFCKEYYEPQTAIVTYFGTEYLAKIHKDRLELVLQLPSGEPRNIVLGGDTEITAHPGSLEWASPGSTPLK